MQSVSQSSQRRAASVVAHSRGRRGVARRYASLPVVALLGASPLSARAAPPDPAPPAAGTAEPAKSAPAIPPLAAPQRVDYGGLLAVSYLVAPPLALALGVKLSEAGASDTVVGVVAGSMALLPTAVHLAHGNTKSGALALPALAGLTGATLLIGGFVGYQLTASSCDDGESDCSFAGLPGAIYGSLAGGLTGYIGYAVYDVLENSSVVTGTSDAGLASVRISVAPLRAARSEARAGSEWSGFHVMASSRF